MPSSINAPMKFALIGAAGYVAPKHMKAIKETGNKLIAAFDPHDSIGILDKYFRGAHFFTEFERFDRHIHKLSRLTPDESIDFVSVCSPNYLHDSHIRFALRSNANAICEKPLVLNHWNIDALVSLEKESGKNVYTVLQLRLHPAIIELKKKVENEFNKNKYEVELTYISARGNWYFNSWKGDEKKSGGIAANIGVHFFDMLYYVFGSLKENKLHYRNEYKAGGYLEYEKARVKWFMSLDEKDVPLHLKEKEEYTFRNMIVDNEIIDFSNSFEGLHTKVYQEILNGNGFGPEENRVAIQIAADIRNQQPLGLVGEIHPMLKNI